MKSGYRDKSYRQSSKRPPRAFLERVTRCRVCGRYIPPDADGLCDDCEAFLIRKLLEEGDNDVDNA